jgi:hypothetical protein
VHGASPVTLTNTGPRVERLAEGLGAKVRFTLAGSGVAVDGTAEVDFDGFIKYALTPRPIAGAVVLDRLRVRLPLRPDEATDFYVLGDHLDHFVAPVATHAGVFWDSLTGKLTRRRELPEYGAWARGPADRPYNFLPFAWLGNHRRGLCFMADDDRPWVLGPPQPALAFENGRVAGQPAVSLCLNLIAAPVTLAPAGPPRTFVFGLMATPSKPPPAGWRQARSKSFYVKSQAGRVMGSSMFAAPYPADFALSKAYTDALWAEGSVPLPYLDYLSADFRMEPVPDFRWEWFPSIRVSDTSALDRTGVPEYGTGSLTDWYLFKFNEWSDRCGVNGFYVDCVHPRRWPDLSTGQDHADGYRLFAMRELFKRLYCLQMAKGRTPPFLIVHMTHTMIGPAMSFADLALEGEDFYHVPDGKDHMDCWPNEHLAIVDNPALWGVGVQWLDRRGDRSGYRSWVTQLLLHDNVRWNAGPPVEAVNAFTATPPEPEFALYRDNRAITAEPAGDIRISYYRKPGEVLAIVGNHAREARVIVLHADLAALALKPPAAWADAETGELLGAGDRRLALTVPPRDCRLLRIQADRAP